MTPIKSNTKVNDIKRPRTHILTSIKISVPLINNLIFHRSEGVYVSSFVLLERRLNTSVLTTTML